MVLREKKKKNPPSDVQRSKLTLAPPWSMVCRELRQELEKLGKSLGTPGREIWWLGLR